MSVPSLAVPLYYTQPFWLYRCVKRITLLLTGGPDGDLDGPGSLHG